MVCPYCHKTDTKVVDKRDNPGTGAIRRRRECLFCLKRFTTYERVESIILTVEKRNGKVVDFDRAKLKSAIIKSAKKGKITEAQVDDIIDDIETKLLNRKSSTVRSTDIGEMVLTRLKKLDKVSYLRFLSVYRDFDTIAKFKKEIDNLA